MKVLSLDTSSKALSVALLEDDQLLAETTLNVTKNHSISLMPTIDFLFASLEMSPQALDRIVVAQGPGSYTGLRVAVATAKTLAYSLGIDLVGLSSLQAIALNCAFDGLVIPLMDARRQNVYVGFYKEGKAVAPDRHTSIESVLERVGQEEKLMFVGEVAPFGQRIAELVPQAKVAEVLPSAYQLGKLGQELEPSDSHSFVPDYLKKVEAEEKWLENHAASSLDYIRRV